MLVTFSPNLTERTKQRLISGDVLYTLSTNLWYLAQGEYQKNSWNEILKFITVAENYGLCLNANLFQRIPSQIIAITWVNLRQLKLSYNSIVSIQCLPFSDMVDLKEICLGNNRITTFKPLSKCKFRRLQYIFLQQNYSKELSFIHRLKTRREMQQLNVFEHEEEIERLLLQDFATIAKLETKKITFLQLNQINKIKQEKTKRVLKNVYTNFDLLNDIIDF